MPLFETRDLAIYASLIATANGGVSLYHGVWRDRPRVKIRAVEQDVWQAGDKIGEALAIDVSNRGRRPVTVRSISRVSNPVRGYHVVTPDLMQETTPYVRLDEGEGRSFLHGRQGGYTHGDLPTSRWCVTDAAGRIYPLGERYRQRVEGFLFWPLRRIAKWRDRRSGA